MNPTGDYIKKIRLYAAIPAIYTRAYINKQLGLFFVEESSLKEIRSLACVGTREEKGNKTGEYCLKRSLRNREIISR